MLRPSPKQGHNGDSTQPLSNGDDGYVLDIANSLAHIHPYTALGHPHGKSICRPRLALTEMNLESRK